MGFVDFCDGAVNDPVTYQLSTDPLLLLLVAIEKVTLDGELRAPVGSKVLLGLHHEEDLERVFVLDLTHRTVAEDVSQFTSLAGELSLALSVLGEGFQQVVQLRFFAKSFTFTGGTNGFNSCIDCVSSIKVSSV